MRLLPLVLTVALAAPVSFLQLTAAERTDTTTTTTTTTTLAKDDVKFLNGANQCGLLEVKAAELVAKRNVTGPTADFAKKIAATHGNLNSDLSSLASKKGVTLPTVLDEDTQKKYEKLAKVEDSKLAKEYLEFEVKAHKAGVSCFKDAAADSKDVDVKAFAAKYLSDLEMHLDEAKRLEKSL